MTDFLSFLSSALPNYLRDLEALVNTDCGTHNKAGVDQVARRVRERCREFGAEVIDYPQPKYGDMLYARWKGPSSFGSAQDGSGRHARILLIGHTDTVYSDGTASQFPFHRRGARLLGPGVSDMKSGLLAGIYAAHAVVQSGFDQFAEIGMFCNSEEEIGSPVSRTLYPQFARGADAALVLEAARESGAIVSARKGVGTYKLKVRGKSAHAGVEPEKGANAILALARYTDALSALNGLRPGLTLNVGVVRGGTRPNVVADLAEAEIDVRVARAADAAPLDEAMRAALVGDPAVSRGARAVVPGTTAELTGGISNPPMEKTDASARLVALAQDAARELGFEIEDVATGGGSDGNHIAALGTPTIDGLGPIGGKSHNAMEEWLDEKSIVPRVALLARLIVKIAEEKR
ncbi:MAG: M20 family metallopeptidase [Chloroflexota bacterium]|nr:M20 family metallopeptidase [Chloroflexota bacterium]